MDLAEVYRGVSRIVHHVAPTACVAASSEGENVVLDIQNILNVADTVEVFEHLSEAVGHNVSGRIKGRDLQVVIPARRYNDTFRPAVWS